jgi:hypothetical protein
MLVLALVITSIVTTAAQLQSQPAPVAKPLASTPKSLATNPPGVLLRLVGEIPQSVDFTEATLGKLKRHSVRAKRHDGVESTYEGVALADILAAAGVPHGNDLRGKAMALYVVAEAADGYKAVYALPELDPSFTDRLILVADCRDGHALPARDGPLQIIVPGEKKHARWVRMLLQLRVARG